MQNQDYIASLPFEIQEDILRRLDKNTIDRLSATSTFFVLLLRKIYEKSKNGILLGKQLKENDFFDYLAFENIINSGDEYPITIFQDINISKSPYLKVLQNYNKQKIFGTEVPEFITNFLLFCESGILNIDFWLQYFGKNKPCADLTFINTEVKMIIGFVKLKEYIELSKQSLSIEQENFIIKSVIQLFNSGLPFDEELAKEANGKLKEVFNLISNFRGCFNYNINDVLSIVSRIKDYDINLDIKFKYTLPMSIIYNEFFIDFIKNDKFKTLSFDNIKQILGAGFNINSKDSKGNSLIYYCVQNILFEQNPHNSNFYKLFGLLINDPNLSIWNIDNKNHNLIEYIGQVIDDYPYYYPFNDTKILDEIHSRIQNKFIDNPAQIINNSNWQNSILARSNQRNYLTKSV